MFESESIPVWLNENFFITIFQDELRIPSKEFRVIIKSVEPVCGHRSLLRIKVDLIKVNDEETMEYPLIVKYLRDSNDEAYSREIAMYEEILPALEYEWKVRNEKMHFAPRLYRTSSDPVKLLVIEEELIAKRQTDLDLNHSKVFLEKLAKYHASTAVYYDKYTTYGESFEIDYAKRKQEFETTWSRVFPKLIELFGNHESLKPYLAKITSWEHIAGDELYNNSLKLNKTALNVLNHGDCKANNLIFSYNERNEVIDVLLIDFQESIFNSPVYDLLYFLVTSPSSDIIRTGQIDVLIKFYHTNLVKYLKKLNYRMHVPSLRELNIEILQRSFWGCYALASTLEFSLLETGSIQENTSCRLRTICKWLDQRGMLDI